MNHDLTTDQFIDILESIDDSIIVINKDKAVTYCNQSLTKLIGVEKSDILEKNIFETIKIFRKRDRTEDNSYFSDALLKGRTVSPKSASYLVTKSGEEIPVKVTVSPHFDQKRKILGAIVTLHNQTTEQENMMIRSDFSYFQHQLGSPLSGTLWNLQLIIEETKSAIEKKKLERIKNAIEGLRTISNKMLVASRLGQGLVNPKFTKTNLSEVLAAVIEKERDKAKDRNVKIKTNFPDKNIVLTTDHEFLTNILIEVLENAIIYSHKDSTVDFNVTEQENGLLFEVQDTGIGIPENELGSVYTKFFRGVNIKEIPGAGLGLHIALQYAKLIKANLWFTSKENVGTSFSVFVPFKI